MVTIDLITGFLGSGKTTLIKQYAGYLCGAGRSIGILENDYGAVNVDMMLLGELEGDLCELEMVAGGCDYDCHKRRFKTKLISMGMCGYNRVLVEPSGIYDVDEFFDVLQEDPLDRWYRIGSVVTLVDAGLHREALSEQSEYLLASQLADAGILVFSRCDLCSREDQVKTLDRINQILEKFQVGRTFSENEVLAKPLNDWLQSDFERISNAGYQMKHLGKFFAEDSREFDTCYFMNRHLNPEQLKEVSERLLVDPSCGQIFRIKGFTRDAEGNWMELNVAGGQICLNPIARGQEVLIVIGENLNKVAIEAVVEDMHG